MLKPRLLASASLVAGLLLLTLTAGPACARELLVSPAGFRGGLELELGVRPFSRLVQYFDLELLQARNQDASLPARLLGVRFYDEYLSDCPRALEQLPRSLRAQLTRGLRLAGHGRGRSPDWPKLNERWRQLPFAEKQATARWENLGSARQAELVIHFVNRLPKRADARSLLSLKQNLPAKVRALFDRLTWARDGDNLIEFQHRSDVHVGSAQALADDILSLARLAGLEASVLDPLGFPMREAALHYHVSVAGADAAAWAMEYNRLLALRRIHRGEVRDMIESARYRFRASVKDKGLMRLFDRDRVEQRVHLQPLPRELGFLTRLLSVSAPEARLLIRAEIESLLDRPTLQRMLRTDHRFTEHFEDYLGEEQRAYVEAYRRRFEQLTNTADGEAIWRRMPHILRSPRADFFELAMGVLNQHEPTPAFFEHLPRLLTDPDVHDDHLQMVLEERVLPAPIEPRVLDALISLGGKLQARLVELLPLAWQRPYAPAARRLRELLLDADLDSEKKEGLLRSLAPAVLSPEEQVETLRAAASQGLRVEAAGLRRFAKAEGLVAEYLWDRARTLLRPSAGTPAGFEDFALVLRSVEPWPADITELVVELLRSARFLGEGALEEGLVRQDHPLAAEFIEQELRRAGGPREFLLKQLRARETEPAGAPILVEGIARPQTLQILAPSPPECRELQHLLLPPANPAEWPVPSP